jgi:hypothetical protein
MTATATHRHERLHEFIVKGERVMTNSKNVGKMTSLDVEVSIPCELFTIPVSVFNNLRYINPQKITSGVIEVATCEFSEHLFILNAKVKDSQIKGIGVTAFGADILCYENPFWGPVIREAWKQEGINIDKLDTSPVDVEGFIKNILKISVSESKEQSKAKAMDHCYIMVRVIDLEELGVLVCFYVCGHWVQCAHLTPTK